MSPEEAARLVGAVQAAASRCRPAKRVWEHLARDVLALLGGLRPCFMIDYAVLPPEFLDALVAALRRESPGGIRTRTCQSTIYRSPPPPPTPTHPHPSPTSQL